MFQRKIKISVDGRDNEVSRIEIDKRFCETISESEWEAILNGIMRHFGTFVRVRHPWGKRWLEVVHISHLKLLNCRAIRCGSCFRSTFWSRVGTRFQLSRVMSPCRTQCCSSPCAHRLHLLDDG